MKLRSLSRLARPRVRLDWLAFLLGTACAPDADTVSFPANVCATDADCGDGTKCIGELKRCADEEARDPYTLVIEVSPTSHSELPARFTFGRQVLTATRTQEVLEIPHALRVNGLVFAHGEMVRAEVSFRAVSERPGYPTATTVVTSSEGTLPAGALNEQAAAEQPHNLTVRLPPMTNFSVEILPLLGKNSAALPPLRTTFQTGSEVSAFLFSYDEQIETLRQTLVDDQTAEPQAGRWLRVRQAEDGRVLSSPAQTGPDGSFELGLLTGSLDSDDYVLEVGLNLDDPWSEVIHVPSQRIDRSGQKPIAIPSVPERVLLTGSVEARLDEKVVPTAELTFVSSFPIPAGAGRLNDLDWCRSLQGDDGAPAFTCGATQTVSTEFDGSYQVSLLPGDYDVYISPSPDSDDRQRVATTKDSISIQTQPLHASQGPRAFQLQGATLLKGSLEDPDRTPLPRVAVRTHALSLKGLLGYEAAYNRSASALTDSKGNFSTAVDTGYYDVVAEAPQDSGYPRLYYPNRIFDVGIRNVVQRNGLIMRLPVLHAGTVTSQGKPLADVDVDAFAIVDDLRGFKRAVLIASTTSDATGHYVLILPTRIDDTKPDEVTPLRIGLPAD